MSRILPDFLIKRPEGYYCPYGDFFVDPQLPVAGAVVSHAHGDHAVPGHVQVYCTAPTAAFMRHRYGARTAPRYREIPYHHPFAVGGVEIRLVPAGHILGSAQVVMEYKGVRYLFTGDYKLQPDSTCEPLQVVDADVLVTESTFADPSIQHPDPIAEINKINGVGHDILLGTYALGKAQRLTALINGHCPDRQVWLHHGILPLHRIYGDFGISLRYGPYNRHVMKTGTSNNIYLVPPMTFNSYSRAKNVIRVFASGWAHLQRHNDLELYISDHVDWHDILRYVRQVKPKQIWTIHGDGRHLAQHFTGNILVRELA